MYVLTLVFSVCNRIFNLNCLVTDEEDPEKGGNKQKKDKQKKITK